MQQQLWKKLLWLTGVSLVVSSTVPVLAQNPPARTYQPGYWQPIARVNSKIPVTVTLINRTDSPLKYSFLDGRQETDLPVGATKQINNFSLPANIAIYDSSPKTAAGKGGGLNYETSVTKNNVTVTVVPVETEGFQVLNINRMGAIYRY